jgi:hypothetical protein
MITTTPLAVHNHTLRCHQHLLHTDDACKNVHMQVQTPGGHTTDSFYFVGNTLVVHNKATFTYDDAGTDTAGMAMPDLPGIMPVAHEAEGGSAEEDVAIIVHDCLDSDCDESIDEMMHTGDHEPAAATEVSDGPCTGKSAPGLGSGQPATNEVDALAEAVGKLHPAR